MLTKTKLALAAIAMFGAACTVQAADKDDGPGGFREGPLGQDLAAPPRGPAAEPRARAVEPKAQEERTEGRARAAEPTERAEPNTHDDKGGDKK
jgi:hypothetical protein